MKIVMMLTTAQAMENQVAIVSMREHLPSIHASASADCS